MGAKKIIVFCLSVFFIQIQIFAQHNLSKKSKAEIERLIKKMTLEEKVTMIHGKANFLSGGIPRLGIPPLNPSDGPHGVRMELNKNWEPLNNQNDSGTYLPTCNTLAATWNPGLGFEFGKVLGEEARYRKKDIILGPGINIIRTPLNGRNFEYLSEDPFLISKMAVGYINGVQSQGVSACVKHFIANNQETNRNTVNVSMSERALNEIYLPGFKAAVIGAKVNSVMGAYNLFRGQYCTHNDFLVNKILKGDWKFDGVLMSDWGAVHDTKEAIYNGTDLEMGTDLNQPIPDYAKFYLADTVITLVRSGEVPESIIDDKVRRILGLMYRSRSFTNKTGGSFATPQHFAVAKKIAEEGIVLLKNNQHILPLSKNVHSVAIIGANAVTEMSNAGGSSQVRGKYEITPLKGIQNLLGSNVNVVYSAGYRMRRNENADSQLIAAAVKTAKQADAVIFVGGWTHSFDGTSNWNETGYDTESMDKLDMNLPFGQDQLITALLDANPNVIIVMMGGGPVDMSKWIDKTNALIQAWYPGMEGGTALARIIFGEVNPSGKLPMTFPKLLTDYPAYHFGAADPGVKDIEYKEGVFVGYRYYDTYGVDPQFPFGYGLSFTTFKYSNLKVTKKSDSVFLQLNLKNTGKVDGAEVVQVYVGQEQSSLLRPAKELKAFQKVFLKAGESKQVRLYLEKDAFSYYNETMAAWVTEPGRYMIQVGSSSKDMRLNAPIYF